MQGTLVGCLKQSGSKQTSPKSALLLSSFHRKRVAGSRGNEVLHHLTFQPLHDTVSHYGQLRLEVQFLFYINRNSKLITKMAVLSLSQGLLLCLKILCRNVRGPYSGGYQWIKETGKSPFLTLSYAILK